MLLEVTTRENLPSCFTRVLQCGGAFYNFGPRDVGYAASVLEEIGARAILVHKEFEPVSGAYQHSFVG